MLALLDFVRAKALLRLWGVSTHWRTSFEGHRRIKVSRVRVKCKVTRVELDTRVISIRSDGRKRCLTRLLAIIVTRTAKGQGWTVIESDARAAVIKCRTGNAATTGHTRQVTVGLRWATACCLALGTIDMTLIFWAFLGPLLANKTEFKFARSWDNAPLVLQMT